MWLLAGLRRSAFNLAHLGLSVGISVVPPWNLKKKKKRKLTSPRARDPRENWRESVQEPDESENIVITSTLKVIAHHFCHGLFFRSESRRFAPAQGKGLVRAWITESGGHWGPLSSCLPEGENVIIVVGGIITKVIVNYQSLHLSCSSTILNYFLELSHIVLL